MNLVNEAVKHRVFGTGKIISVDNGYITIEFKEKYGEKRFRFPDAFEEFLTVEDRKVQEFILEELKIVSKKIQEDRLLQAQEQVEELSRQMEHKKTTKRVSKKKVL